MRRALVTGGAGFIGSQLVDALVVTGVEVTVLDDFSTGRPQNLRGARTCGAHVELADVRDAAAVDAAVAAARPDVLFHLAAQIDVRRSLRHPEHDAAVNVIGTLNVLEAARKHRVRRVVNTSTGGAIYGAAEQVPTPESAPPRPASPYGTGKLCGEQYCAWSSRLHGLSVVTLRLANVYGARQDPRGEAGVIARFCDALLDGRRPTIFGDGSQTRDFVHVSDVVAAQLAAAESEVDGVVNVGTGRETSVLELVAAVSAAGGVAPERFRPVHERARTGEVHRSCLDASRAGATLGVVPQVALVDGLARTLAWIRDEARNPTPRPRLRLAPPASR